jgi:thiaminase
MTTANEIIERARTDAAATASRLTDHPYVAAIEAGTVSRAELLRFAGEQYHIISSDLRSVALLASRFGGDQRGDFFLDVLEGEKAALRALEPLAAGLGGSAADLAAYEPLAGAHAYTCYMAWLGMYGSAGAVAAAYLVNFPAWGANCARLSQALRHRYSLSADAVRFFDQFAAEDPAFEPTVLAIVQDDLDRGADPRAILRAPRLLQAYELLYWDTLHAASEEAS